MKRVVFVACVAVFVLASLAVSLERAPSGAVQSNVSGFWAFRVPRADGTFQETYFELKQDGETVTGKQGQRDLSEGNFKDGVLHMVVIIPPAGTQPNPTRLTYEGKVEGGNGSFTLTGRGPNPTAGELVRVNETTVRPMPLPALHDVPDNGLVRTPPMGWNSWNKFAGRVTDADVRGMADAMVSSGMARAGYIYINIDDTWEGQGRDKNGNFTTNSKFPDMKALADYVHSKGLKIGIYSSPGPKTCAGYEGSYGHEEQDAKQWAAWGFDYLKYDWCSASQIYKDSDMQAVYQKMGDALLKAGRPIVYSLCQYGRNEVWKWGAQVGGNLWRTTGDIRDRWQSLDRIGFGPAVPNPVQGRPGFTQMDISLTMRPGVFNDPDMLEIGNGGMSGDEYRLHMSLWSMLSAPLLAGNDLRTMTDEIKSILMNSEVIAVDQDKLVAPPKNVYDTASTLVLTKQLADKTAAVAFFNRGDAETKITVPLKDLGLTSSTLRARDLWAHADVALSGESYTATVPRHGVVMLKVAAR